MHELFKNNLFLSKISHIQFFLFISFYFNLFLILLALLSIIFWRISIVFFWRGGCGITKSYAISFLRNVKNIKKQRSKQLMVCLYFWCDDFIPHTLTYFFPLTFFSHFTFCFAPGLLSHFYVLCFVLWLCQQKTLECRL